MGYHITQITKGKFGEISKIQEELDELKDAELQDCKILKAVELSDLYGALQGYALTQGLTMTDLEQMSNLTQSAFQDGARTPKVEQDINKNDSKYSAGSSTVYTVNRDIVDMFELYCEDDKLEGVEECRIFNNVTTFRINYYNLSTSSNNTIDFNELELLQSHNGAVYGVVFHHSNGIKTEFKIKIK